MLPTRHPVVLRIPHASARVPPEDRAAIALGDAALARELVRMTDAYTDELFDLGPSVACVVFPVSRLVVDPERFEDDELEPLAARGMGVIYTETSQRTPLRAKPDAPTREDLLARYYRPHLARLTAEVGAQLERHDRCLVIDCHSFPSKPLPYELDQSADRPEICIGTDRFHTPEDLAVRFERGFRDGGFTVARNRPFAGALVPSAYYERDRRVTAVMVEVNRRLYMNEATGERLAGFGEFAGRLTAILKDLVLADSQGRAG